MTNPAAMTLKKLNAYKGFNSCEYISKVCCAYDSCSGLFVPQAEWLAAQMDEQALEGVEDEEDEGVSFIGHWLCRNPVSQFSLAFTHESFYFPQDTDSLMEWWYTVERESKSNKQRKRNKKDF